MCLKNFRNNLSTALMAQTFEGFNDMCTKARDMELQLYKRKKPSKESSKVGNIMTATDQDLPKDRDNRTKVQLSTKGVLKQHLPTPFSWVQTTERDTRPIFQEKTTEGVFFRKGSY